MSFLMLFYFLSTSKKSLHTDVLYNTSEAAFEHQPSAIELGLVKHILQRPKLLCFLFHHLCISIHLRQTYQVSILNFENYVSKIG